ncbi:hypothetical protein FDC51_15800 [Clostridium botulinum]|nr:hypothetical protein [Clostridium botulinum]
MNFNWSEFKKGEIVVYCDTKEKAINFLSECNLQNIKWVDKEDIIPTKCYFEKYETGIGYRFVPFESNEYCHGLTYDCLEFYETIGSNIIEWEIENKIDYDREYDIYEVMEFPEGTELLYKNKHYKIKDEELYFVDKNREFISQNSLKDILTMKFKIIKKDKKVEFMQAIQAYGKTVYCIWRDKNDKMLKTFYEIKSNVSEIFDTNDSAMCSEEILNGGWYIKED